MAVQKLKKFLTDLAQNPAKQQEYLKNPTKVMDDHGVDPEHQKLILDGDMGSLGKVLGGTDACPILIIHNYKK